MIPYRGRSANTEAWREEGSMRGTLATAVACVLVAVLSTPAAGGVVDVAVGVCGGAHYPMDSGGSAGTLLGAKLRVLPPLPMLGAEVYYQRFFSDEASDVWNDGDVSLDLEDGAFDVFGADVLIGSVKGVPGFKWYGIVGVNFVEFSQGDSSERRMGGQAGLGLEVVPPIIGLAVEGRATVAVFGLGEEPDPKVATLSLGVNYYF